MSYPNAAARTVEEAVVAPLRNTLLQVNRLTDLRSRSRDEAAVLYLDFPFGTNADLAFIEVNEKIDQAMNLLPREVPRPRVLATDVSDVPVVQLSVTLAGPATPNDDRTAELLELSELAQTVLRRRLEQLPEIAFADLSGQREPRLVVRPRRSSLLALGLDENRLADLLRRANVEVGGLLLADGHYEYAVRFSGQLRTADDLRQLYLRLGQDGAVRTVALGDLADISYEAAPARGLYLYDDRPGVVFTLRKRADARLFDLRDNLATLLADLETAYPTLRFALNNDQTAILRASIDNLTGGLLYGAGFAVLILFAFFREWRRPLLIAVAVPVALLIAILGFYLAGLSINVISLAGLILGLGLMIDNSIIVLDNIAQYRQQAAAEASAPDPAANIAAATNEVIRPLITSALTTTAVFLPLVLLSGIAGALFRDQAVAVTLALAASLLVAYFLLPALSLLLPNSTPSEVPFSSTESVSQTSEIGMEKKGSLQESRPRSPRVTARRRIATPLLLLLWLVVGYLLLNHLPTRGFPTLSRTDFRLTVDWNEPRSLSEYGTRARALIKDWQRTFGGSTAAFIGEDQFLLNVENRARTAAELQFYLSATPPAGFAVAWLDSVRAAHPGASFSFAPLPNLFDRIFLSDEPYAEVRLRPNTGRMTPPWSTVEPLVARLQAAGLRPVPPPRNETVALSVDYVQLGISRVDAAALQARLLTFFSENEVTRLRTGNRTLPVTLAATAAPSLDRLLATTVRNRDGNLIPLRYLLRVERRPNYRVLTADRAGEYLALPLDGAPAPDRLRAELAAFPGLNGQLSGRFLTDQSRLRELGGVLLISLLLLYLILAAQFEGLRLPFVVLLVVPVSLVGSLLALYLSGETLNLLSLIGMVVCGGIVVNDAIIKVDMIQRGRAAGLPLDEALREATRRRLRAIVMTSLTTILALVPVLFTGGLGSELQRPLAITVIGGLAVGTLASLYVTPWLYRVFGPR